MKRCDLRKKFVDHISSFQYFAIIFFKIRRYLTCTTPYTTYLAYCTKIGKQGVASTENVKTSTFLTACYYHITCLFQNEYILKLASLAKWLNVFKLASLAKWLNVCLRECSFKK